MMLSSDANCKFFLLGFCYFTTSDWLLHCSTHCILFFILDPLICDFPCFQPICHDPLKTSSHPLHSILSHFISSFSSFLILFKLPAAGPSGFISLDIRLFLCFYLLIHTLIYFGLWIYLLLLQNRVQKGKNSSQKLATALGQADSTCPRAKKVETFITCAST